MEAGHPLGQWEAVRTHWGPYRLSLMQDLWRQFGPPAYVSLGVLAGTSQAAAKPEPPKDTEAGVAELMTMFPQVQR